MASFIASLDQRRQYLLRHLFGRDVSAVNGHNSSNAVTMPQVSVNSSGDLSLKLTFLCFLTTLGGYLADAVVIERLLHPARFYNSDPADFITNLQLMTTASLGCSTLQILLHCFQVLRLHGLFDPQNSPSNKSTSKGNLAFGNILGTPFYPAHHALSRARCNGAMVGVGDGFWARVLELIPHSKVHAKFDYEVLEHNRLKLRAINKYDKKKQHSAIADWDQKLRGPKPYVVTEGKSYAKYFDDIVISEFPAVVLMFYYGFVATRLPGYFPFMLALMYPLMTKLMFAIISLDRKTFHVLNAESANNTDVFEIQFGGSRLSSIEVEHALFHRFLEYYGQPIRNILTERILVVALALCLGPLPFIVALFALNTDYAHVWLAHQAFVMFGWFMARILNLNSCGRTEERIARALHKGQKVVFVNADATSALEVALCTSFVAPKPANAPTLVSAKPLVTIAEETENAAGAFSIPSTSTSVEAGSTVQDTPPQSSTGSDVMEVDAEPYEPQTHGFQAPTTPAAILQLPNSASKLMPGSSSSVLR
ncbi:hypothetical protein FKW77_009855 [Venturia effusa]|uniref:Uncharacterized protein n=1 Tax=Venturia effusa TaxID=50376 RepID=A0A517L669_9PEZI|nr:hypothetical protein FKW77_009855 [Venturia effusa]